ncbi:kinase-like domain-containing protein [Rhizophagus irregularis DAOM 181602=DAOM 197198]|nr:kinase-like domain-containing protein [Rhizophagus irregularis DAOM 181602=DAOM 197198]
MSSQNTCKKCGEVYTDIREKWCKQYEVKTCSTNLDDDEALLIYGITQNPDTKKYFMVLQDDYLIDKGDFATVYSAKWKDGPLRYNANKKEYVRNLNQAVDLKCVYDSQNIIDEFLNEVLIYSKAWLISFHSDKISKIYGISQHPDTKDYIMVLKSKYCEHCSKNFVSNNNEMNTLCESCQIHQEIFSWDIYR